MNPVTNASQVRDWPLWRVAITRLREREDYGYGLKLDVSWFERELGCKSDTNEFRFGMLELRSTIEHEDGYYLQGQTVQDDETGVKTEVFQIPTAPEHEVVAHTFENKMRSYASRSMLLRKRTLENPTADLSIEDRNKMEKAEEIAATRIILLRREKSIVSALREKLPKLLQ